MGLRDSEKERGEKGEELHCVWEELDYLAWVYDCDEIDVYAFVPEG